MRAGQRVADLGPRSGRAITRAASPAWVHPGADPAAVSPGVRRAGAELLRMQQRYGNRYVSRFVGQLRQEGPAAALDSAVEAAAAHGVEGEGRALPHADRVQAGLGEDLAGVRAYTGPSARAVTRDLGVEAFTMGNRIAFADPVPSLATVAHEVVHVLQQRAGGRGGGRTAEVRAEAAAAAVGQGRSAAGFLPATGFGSGSAVAAPVMQAKVTLKQPQSYLASWFQSADSRQLVSLDGLMAFLEQHGVDLDEVGRARYSAQHAIKPGRLGLAAARMLGHRRNWEFEDSETGARELAEAVAKVAFGRMVAPSQPVLRPSDPGETSPINFGRGYQPRSSGATTFETLREYGRSAWVPQTLADYKSRQFREKVQEKISDNPIQAGVMGAFTDRAEALTQLPQDPRKALDAVPWVSWCVVGGGLSDMREIVDITASKMSPGEAEKYRKAFDDLQLDKEVKMVASLGTGVAVGQVLGAIPHPVAQGARVAWTASGGVALNNKLAKVGEDLEKFKHQYPKTFRTMEEHRDAKMAPINAKAERFSQQVKEDLMERATSPWG